MTHSNSGDRRTRLHASNVLLVLGPLFLLTGLGCLFLVDGTSPGAGFVVIGVSGSLFGLFGRREARAVEEEKSR